MSDTLQASVSVSESTRVLGFQVGAALQMAFMQKDIKWVLSEIDGGTPFGPRETISYGIVRDIGIYKVLGLFEQIVRRPLIGQLWIDSTFYGASPKVQWTLHVHGRSNLSYFIEVAKGLAEQFKVKVHIELTSESQRQPYRRSFDSGY